MQFYDQVLREKVNRKTQTVVRTASALGSDGFVLEKQVDRSASSRRPHAKRPGEFRLFRERETDWISVDGPTPRGWILLRRSNRLALCSEKSWIEFEYCEKELGKWQKPSFAMRDLPDDEVLLGVLLLAGGYGTDQLKVLRSREASCALQSMDLTGFQIVPSSLVDFLSLEEEVGLSIVWYVRSSFKFAKMSYDLERDSAAFEIESVNLPDVEETLGHRFYGTWSSGERILGCFRFLPGNQGEIKLWRRSRGTFVAEERKISFAVNPLNLESVQLIGNHLAAIELDGSLHVFVDLQTGQTQTLRTTDTESWIGPWRDGARFRLKKTGTRGMLQLVKTRILRQRNFPFGLAWARGCREVLKTLSDEQRAVAWEVMLNEQEKGVRDA